VYAFGVGYNGARERPTTSGPRQQSERVIVDASNVAHATEGSATLANVRLVRDRLTQDGLTPILVADAALRHQIDDAGAYEWLVKEVVLERPTKRRQR
jgi:hypothetical protein